MSAAMISMLDDLERISIRRINENVTRGYDKAGKKHAFGNIPQYRDIDELKSVLSAIITYYPKGDILDIYLRRRRDPSNPDNLSIYSFVVIIKDDARSSIFSDLNDNLLLSQHINGGIVSNLRISVINIRQAEFLSRYESINTNTCPSDTVYQVRYASTRLALCGIEELPEMLELPA